MVAPKDLSMMIARCAMRARLKSSTHDEELAITHFQQLLEREIDEHTGHRPPRG